MPHCRSTTASGMRPAKSWCRGLGTIGGIRNKAFMDRHRGAHGGPPPRVLAQGARRLSWTIRASVGGSWLLIAAVSMGCGTTACAEACVGGGGGVFGVFFPPGGRGRGGTAVVSDGEPGQKTKGTNVLLKFSAAAMTAIATRARAARGHRSSVVHCARRKEEEAERLPGCASTGAYGC